LAQDIKELPEKMTANEMTSALLVQIPKRFPGARVWRSNRVDVMAQGRGGQLRRVKAGVDGQGDITGIFPVATLGYAPPYGLRIELEIKAGRDKQSPAQKDFQKMIRAAGGIYLVCRDVEECLAELARWV
jgi:hypothetical protein